MRPWLLQALLIAGCHSAFAHRSRYDSLQRCYGSSSRAGDVCTIAETTNPEIEGQQVGVADIFERDLAGPDGIVAKRRSAFVAIYDPISKVDEHHIVIVGAVLQIGAVHYRVRDIDVGDDAPGWLVLERMAN